MWRVVLSKLFPNADEIWVLILDLLHHKKQMNYLIAVMKSSNTITLVQ